MKGGCPCSSARHCVSGLVRSMDRARRL